MTLWTAADAAAQQGGQARSDWQASGISIDTRSLQPGDLFIALKAARDGHDFVAQGCKRAPPPRWCRISPKMWGQMRPC
jgi:UDP-N-acetylmuramoyl-tripeptide--D-alanyl-D-alanine ligase